LALKLSANFFSLYEWTEHLQEFCGEGFDMAWEEVFLELSACNREANRCAMVFFNGIRRN
jgi:hypothetical protein